MSGREWKPGDVALVRICSYLEPEVAVSSGDQWFVAGPRLGSRHGWYHDHVEVVRPLAVIDYEDPEQVASLARALVQQGAMFGDRGVSHTGLAAALREFADPTPPKPREPRAVGAVVEDARGRLWVRVDHDDMPWRVSDDEGGWADYADIDAVKVLSSGVEPLADWERELLDGES